MIAAEVVYAARHEYCQSTCDFIARRTRLAFLDADAAEAALPEVRGPKGGGDICICVFCDGFVCCLPACLGVCFIFPSCLNSSTFQTLTFLQVTKLLAKELGWGRRRAARELADAKQFLTTFRV